MAPSTTGTTGPVTPESGAADRGSAGPPLRLLLGAFGDPGHAFPMIGLGTALAARGHDVTLQTWVRWRADVERAGMTFAPAPEYKVFPTSDSPMKPYAAAVRAARETRPLVADVRPHAVVADVLTLAPALAGELEQVPVATLVPHVHPLPPPGAPPFSIGARAPRTALGRAFWRALGRPTAAGLRRGRDELNEARRRLGLPPHAHVLGGISDRLCLVATLPQLEYPRNWPPRTHVIGPLLWEPPTGDIELPPGEAPLVLVAPSTAHDSQQRLLRATVHGLRDAPVRVIATWNRPKPPPVPLNPGSNTRVVNWLSYARTMPHCALVVCHGGHGTLVRALASGCVTVVSPAAGDQLENAARIDWAGVGVRIPTRLMTPRSMRLAVERALGDPAIARRAAAMRAWSREHDAATRGAELVEQLARESALAAP